MSQESLYIRTDLLCELSKYPYHLPTFVILQLTYLVICLNNLRWLNINRTSRSTFIMYDTRILRFNPGATGITRRPSRRVGVTSFSTKPHLGQNAGYYRVFSICFLRYVRAPGVSLAVRRRIITHLSELINDLRDALNKERKGGNAVGKSIECRIIVAYLALFCLFSTTQKAKRLR